jgi:hypothetical protein
MADRRTTLLGIAAILILVILGATVYLAQNASRPFVASFQECVDAGYPVMESYPRQCRVPDGETYVESVSSASSVSSVSTASSSTAASSFSSRSAPAANITVSEPAANQLVTSPLTIRGTARVFENTVSYRIVDETGRNLAEGFTTAQSPDTGQFGPYAITAELASDIVPQNGRGFIEVFTESAQDGSEIDKVRVPVRFANADQTEVKLYFGSRSAAVGRECEALSFVPVLVQKDAPARHALERLLQGPVGDANAITAIAAGTTLNSVTIADGVARADFSAQLQNYGGGSCTVGLIRDQIERTLKQFPSVREVVISVEGRIDDVLQP